MILLRILVKYLGLRMGYCSKPSDHSWVNPLSRVTSLQLNTDQILAVKQIHSVANLSFIFVPRSLWFSRWEASPKVNRSREKGAGWTGPTEGSLYDLPWSHSSHFLLIPEAAILNIWNGWNSLEFYQYYNSSLNNVNFVNEIKSLV